jgi:hypothetical protein
MAAEALWKIGRPDYGGHEDPSHLARSADPPSMAGNRHDAVIHLNARTKAPPLGRAAHNGR